MKDTPEIRRFLYRKLKHYCNKLGLKGNKTPEVLFTGVALKEKKNAMMHDKRDFAHYIYDVDCKICLIHINLRAHRNLNELEDSLVHELIHITHTSLPHGKTFQNHIKELMEC